jgi:O-antigen/teichoic acid export membrane protein
VPAVEPPVESALPAPQRVTGTALVRSTLINAAATVGGMAIALALTPFMLGRLGSSSFGVWALALTLTVGTGYLSLTDLGLQQAAVRFIADARREDDDAAIAAIFSTTLAIFVSLAIAIAAGMVALAPVLAGVFGVHAELRHAAILAFAIVGAQVVFDLPGLAFRAVLESDQRFGALRAVELGRSAAFAGLVVAVLVLGRGVVAVAAASATAALAALVAYVVVVARTDHAARVHPRSVSRERLRELLRFSGSLFVLRILSVVYRQMDKVIIGVVLAVSAVATYEVANRIQAALFMVVGLGGSTLLPAAALSRLDNRMMRDLFLRATSYSVALFMPVCVAAVVYAHQIVVGWVGEGQVGATNATRLFALWVAVGTFDAAGTTMLVAAGRLKPILLLTIIWVTANLALSLVFVHIWGITGVVAGTVVSYGPLLVAYTVLCLREFEITGREWLQRVLAPNLPGPVAQVALSLATYPLVERLPPLPGAFIAGTVGTAVSVAIFLFVGIRGEERAYLRAMLMGATRRQQRPVI